MNQGKAGHHSRCGGAVEELGKHSTLNVQRPTSNWGKCSTRRLSEGSGPSCLADALRAGTARAPGAAQPALRANFGKVWVRKDKHERGVRSGAERIWTKETFNTQHSTSNIELGKCSMRGSANARGHIVSGGRAA